MYRGTRFVRPAVEVLFSYTPPANVANAQDTFQYRDWETDPSGQHLVFNLTGPVKSSPTVVNFPGFPIAQNTVVFGTDGQQVYGDSGGRVYALRPDGSVAWEALLAGPVHGSPLVVPPSMGHPDGEVWVETEANNWGGNPTQPGATSGRLYELDAITGQVLAERIMLGQGEMDGSPALLAGTGGAANQIFATTSYGFVYDVTDTPTTPPSGQESPSPTVLWMTQIGLNPTSATISPLGNNIYVGDNNGMHALPVAGPGAPGGWTVGLDPSGTAVYPVVGSPAVVMDAVTGNPEVIWGSEGSVGKVYSYDDSPAGPVFNWSVQAPSGGDFAFGLSSPAIGPPPFPGGQAPVFIGSKDGSVLDLG